MSTVNRETLRTFLTAYARNPDRTPGAMELLEPFFTHAEAERYALAPASDLDQETVKAAIATAIGKPVTRVIFVSGAKPERMTEDAYRASPWANLGGSLGVNLGGSLKANLGGNLWESLGGSLWDSLGVNLRARLRARLGDSIGASLWDSLGVNLGVSLIYFLGFVILNDAEKIERLTPLIQLLPKAIPIGEKKDEPGTWLVLVA